MFKILFDGELDDLLTLQADMGAPFYLNEQYYGIVTYAPGCDHPDLPIVVTGIAKFTSFIIMVLCDMKNMFGSSLQDNLQTFALPDSFHQELFSVI